MIPIVGKKYLITPDAWFLAPDGQEYKSVFGTVGAISNDEETLGIKTNGRSTNWYVSIGNMVIAGCQIHYCIQTDEVYRGEYVREEAHEGKVIETQVRSRIYMADEKYCSPEI